MPTEENPQVNREIERLATMYANLILRLAYARLGSTHAAQDICQDVFVRLIRLTRVNAGAFENPEHEKAWIIRATVNACINEQQAARNHRVVPLEPAGKQAGTPPRDIPDPSATNPADAAESAESHQRVLAALTQLPPAQHQAIYLHYCEGYSSKEIAQITGEKPATVRQHLARGRAKLRDLLEGENL